MASANAKIANFRVNSPLAEHLGINQDFDLNEWFQKLSSGVGQGLGLLVGGLTTVISVGSEAVLILVFSILFLGSRIHLRDASEKILAQYPSCNGPGLIDESVALIQKFLVARMAIVVIIGVLAGFVLFLLGVKYFIFLGAFIGILTLVPAVGGIIGIVVTVVAAIISGHSTTSVLVIASLLLSVSLLEAYVLTPKMVGNRLNINALATFIGLFAGGLLWGVWGMFLSIPILAVMRIVFKTIPSLNAWGELLADEDVVKAKGRVIKPKA